MANSARLLTIFDISTFFTMKAATLTVFSHFGCLSVHDRFMIRIGPGFKLA
jgi:hypothetical protein